MFVRFSLLYVLLLVDCFVLLAGYVVCLLLLVLVYFRFVIVNFYLVLVCVAIICFYFVGFSLLV